ncbi:MAG: hypothetical protein WD069_01395 [Planctomycetales bacterium]
MTIEQRLAKLERENRTWRCTALGLLLIAGGYVGCSRESPEPEPQRATVDQIMAAVEAEEKRNPSPPNLTFEEAQRLTRAAQSPAAPAALPDKLRVKSLEIVNDEGRVLASLGSDGRGASLKLSGLDATGNTFDHQVSIETDMGRSSILVRSGDNCTTLTADHFRMFEFPRHAPVGVGVRITESDTSVRIAAAESGAGVIHLYKGGTIDVFSSLGKKVVSVQSNKKNEGAISINDVSGEVGTILTSEAVLTPEVISGR